MSARFLGLLALGLGLVTTAMGQGPPGPTNSWIDGTGNWSISNHWSLAVPPYITDGADLITNVGNKTVTINALTSSLFPNSLTINNLIVAAPLNMTNTTNTLSLNNAGTNTPLTVFFSLDVGSGGSMVLINSALQVGVGPFGGALTVDGQLTMDSGTILVSSNLLVGSSNSLSLVTISGGALYVTNAAHSAVTEIRYGTLVLTGGVYFTDSLLITNTGGSFLNDGGTFTITGLAQVDQGTQTVSSGTTQLSSNLVVGTSANSTGTVSVTGGQLVATNGVIGIGNSGTLTNGSGVGTMTVSNGTVLASTILLGSTAGGQGQLTVQTNGLVSMVATGAMVVANDLTVAGGDVEIVNGIIYCGESHPGAMTMSNGTANCQITYVGYDSQGTLTMVAGQMTVSSLLDIGFASTSTGSVWMSGGQLTATALPTIIGNSGVGQFNLSGGALQASTIVVGNTGGPGGTLTVGGGTFTASAGLNVGTAAQSTGSVWVSGGQLVAVSSSLVIGNSSGLGQMIISNGSVQANSVVLTNGANSRLALIGGALSSGGTVVTNSQQFVVGNGSSSATFNLLGGVHWFGNGLEIANNSTLTGCGTVNGVVTINAGAHAVSTCGTLTFTGTVINNGVARASNGSALNFDGPVVNNNAIDALNGTVTFSSTPTGNGYILTSNCVPVITAIQQVGPDIHVSFTTCNNAPYAVEYETDLVTGSWTPLTNATGTGGIITIVDSGATLLPQRFYRVNLVVPS